MEPQLAALFVLDAALQSVLLVCFGCASALRVVSVCCLSLACVCARHFLALCVRPRVFSSAVQLLHDAVFSAPLHLIHAAATAAVALAILHPLLSEHIVVAAALSGLNFSWTWLRDRHDVLVFPDLQRRRWARLREELPWIIASGVARAVGSVAAAVPLVPPRHVNEVAESFKVCALANVGLLLSAALHKIVLTQCKPFVTCSLDAVDSSGETEKLLKALELCERGSVEEALRALPLPPPQAGTVPARPSSAPRSDLLEFAHAAVGKGKGGIASAAALREWWSSVVRLARAAHMYRPRGEEMCSLAQRRFEAVQQAIYTADAKEPGRAFTRVCSLPPLQQVLRARAFADLDALSASSERHRRLLLGNPATLSRVVDSCLAVIDGLTITLRVATMDCAAEPTVPTDSHNNPQDSVFILQPSPHEQATLNTDERAALLWASEAASRRASASTFAGWWAKNVMARFREYDPVAAQRELQDASVRERDAKDVTTSLAWERQWRQTAHQRSLIGRLIAWLNRNSQQRTRAVFSGSQTVLWAIHALGNLIKSGDFPVVGIRLITESMQRCLEATVKFQLTNPTTHGDGPYAVAFCLRRVLHGL